MRKEVFGRCECENAGISSLKAPGSVLAGSIWSFIQSLELNAYFWEAVRHVEKFSFLGCQEAFRGVFLQPR